jgi:two-component system, cell cycle sensor histidine kinase and response regulator CckA
VALCDVEVDGPEDRDLLYQLKGPYVKLSVKQMVHGVLPEQEGAERTSLGERGPDIALIRGIVEEHGGKMVVYKETGEGVTFQTFLPRMECRTAEGEGKSLLLPRGSESVLLVDDEPAILETLKQMLDYLGYTVVSTTSSVEALEIFRDSPGRFDVVITDKTMPRMSGIHLAEKVNRIRPDLPILLCSGFDETPQDRELGKIGVRALLVKPHTAREIATKIRQVLNGGTRNL